MNRTFTAFVFLVCFALGTFAQASIQNLALGDKVTVAASSSYNAGYGPEGTIDGDRKGSNWGNGGGWSDATRDVFPDTLTISFPAGRTYAVSRVVIYSMVDSYPSIHEPTNTEVCANYNIKDFSVDALDSFGNVIASQSVTNNTLCRAVVDFPSVAGKVAAVRLTITADWGHFAAITEVEIQGRQ